MSLSGIASAGATQNTSTPQAGPAATASVAPAADAAPQPDSGDAAPASSASVTLSDQGKTAAALEAQGLTVTVQSLGQFFAPALFVDADTDLSSSLSKNEFETALAGKGDSSKQIDALFTSMDKDASGQLSATEFIQGITDNLDDKSFNAMAMDLLVPNGNRSAQGILMAFDANRAATALLKDEGAITTPASAGGPSKA